MNELIVVGVVLALIIGSLFALAPRVSEALVRSSARRLPSQLSERMHEEWLAELEALAGRASRLGFAIALTLTRRHSFAIEDESLFAAPSRAPITIATFGGWPLVVLLTTVVMAAIAYAGSFLIQPVYESRVHILVVRSQLPARIVESSSHISLRERVRTIRGLVLSNQRLERIIREFNLYQPVGTPPKREQTNANRAGAGPIAGRPPVTEAALARMRGDIGIEVREAANSFEIAYTSHDPRMAMSVADRLANLFINESLQERSHTSQAATQFLAAQIESVRSRLLRQTDASGRSELNSSDADITALEREGLKATYRDLLIKRERANISANVEMRALGEQFKRLDRARLPEVPVRPDRARLARLGAVVGFCLSIAMMIADRGRPFTRRNKVLAQS